MTILSDGRVQQGTDQAGQISVVRPASLGDQVRLGENMFRSLGELTLRSADVNSQEVKGVFNSQTKLAKAIDIFDLRQIERILVEPDKDFDRVNFVRAEVGARQRFLDVIERRSEAEELELRRVLSLEIDTDFVAAISDLTGKQASLEASLKLYGNTFGLTLLDYL